jgi:hypothetical protein
MIDKKPRYLTMRGAFLISSFLTHYFRAEITTAVESPPPSVSGPGGFRRQHVSTLAR